MKVLVLILCGCAWAEASLFGNKKNSNIMREHTVTRAENVKKETQAKVRPKHQQARGPAAMELFHVRKPGWCRYATTLMKKNTLAMKKVDSVMEQINKNLKMSAAEKEYHITRFHVIKQELNETENMIVSSLTWLQSTLNGDYKDMMNMKDSAKERLVQLRDATLKEEQEYKTLVKSELQLKALNETQVHGVVEDILHDVAQAANQLEADLDDHVFDKAAKNPVVANGAHVEAVIRIEDEDEPELVPAEGNETARTAKESAGVIKLVDVEENQFVLSKGKDSTVPHEDHHLIKDMVFLLLLSFALGGICTLVGLPAMFGFILTGVILGPSGANIFKSLVQIETIGEFGVFFILFSVGLEFTPEKIRKVIKVSAIGGTSLTLVMVLCGVAFSFILDAKPQEFVFIGACLSLSSTPLVVKFLSSSDENNTEGPSNTDYGTTLMGILVMQDVLLGLIMALLPILADSGTKGNQGFEVYLMIALKLVCAILAVILVAFISSRFVIKYLLTYVLRECGNDMILLGSVAVAFSMLLLTEYLQVSMELGCFLAGVMISAQGPVLSDQVEHIIQPVRDFLGCVFFVSIGLHVFPSFMGYEITYLTTFTISTVGLKLGTSAAVLTLVLPQSSQSVKWVVAAGLAQVSEFAFVLSSRARRLGLVSREVYLLIISVTTFSLLMAPLVWRATLWQLRIKTKRSGRFSDRNLSNRSRSATESDAQQQRERDSPELHEDGDFLVVSLGSKHQTTRRTLST